MRRRGFTLIEMLVVVGIVTLLISFAIPLLAKANRYAVRSRMKADLLAIGQALEAYRMDHRDYPRLIPGDEQRYGEDYDGSELLCWALVAPGPAEKDGADGPGFRIRGTRGQVYGPYLNPAAFTIANTDEGPVLLDRDGQKINYCAATPNANITAPKGFVADDYGSESHPLYDHAYLKYCLSVTDMRSALGDANTNGQIDPNETPACTGPYLLWCAGPNGVFGPDPDDPTHRRSDDVTNFRP